MLKVKDVDEAAKYYSDVFGLIPEWKHGGNVGLKFPESDSEIVLHNIKKISNKIDVNYLVENVDKSIQCFLKSGCEVLVEPFDIQIGKCAVIKDPFGIEISILDMTKGPVKNNLEPGV